MHDHPPPIDPTTPSGAGAHLVALDDMEALFGRPEPMRHAVPAPSVTPRRPATAVIAALVAMIALVLVFAVRTPARSERHAVAAPRAAAVPRLGTDAAAMAAVAAVPLVVRPTKVATDLPDGQPTPLSEPLPPPERTASREKASPGRPDTAPVAIAADPCAGNDDRPDCIDATLRAADFTLRRAYYAAADAGIDPDALRHYRREWVRVRRYAGDDPQGTIDNYRGMARDLDALARDDDRSPDL